MVRELYGMVVYWEAGLFLMTPFTEGCHEGNNKTLPPGRRRCCTVCEGAMLKCARGGEDSPADAPPVSRVAVHAFVGMILEKASTCLRPATFQRFEGKLRDA